QPRLHLLGLSYRQHVEQRSSKLRERLRPLRNRECTTRVKHERAKIYRFAPVPFNMFRKGLRDILGIALAKASHKNIGSFWMKSVLHPVARDLRISSSGSLYES